MTRVRVKGFQILKDRYGKMRCYHRATRMKIDLEMYPLGSAGFFAACERITKLSDPKAAARPGTLQRLIQDYRAHQSFTDLAARTKVDYDKVFNYLAPIDDTQLDAFTPPFVVGIRDKAFQAKGYRFANYVKTVLSLIFAWGVERGYLQGNPAKGVKKLPKPKGALEANRPWTDAERLVVEKALPAHMRLPIALMMYHGLDPQDSLKLPRSAIEGGRINTRRGRTGQPVWAPISKPVKAAIDSAPKHDAITLCANKSGKPWTVSGFQSSWRKVKLRLEAEGMIGPHLTLKGLRHTVATVLAELGYEERAIADMLGQKTTDMARHYSRRADRSQKMEGIIKNFDAEMNKRRTKL